MLGYILLVLALLFSGSIHDNSKKLFIMMFSLTLFAALRYGIGYDYYSYLKGCDPNFRGSDLREPIPDLFRIWAQNTFPYMFFILTSIFISLFYWLALRRSDQNHYIEVLFYAFFPFQYLQQLGTVRQGMATAVVFFALSLSRDTKWLILKQIVLIILAYMCHSSAIAALLLLIKWEKLNRIGLWSIFVGSFILSFLIAPILIAIIGSGIIMGGANAEIAIGYLKAEDVVEGRMIRYLIYALTIISLINYKKIVSNSSNYRYYLSLMILGSSIYALLSFNSTLSYRLCMFFFSAAIFIMPRLIKAMKVTVPVYTVLLLTLFILQVYIGSNNIRENDPPGCSVTYPYRTFLEE